MRVEYQVVSGHYFMRIVTQNKKLIGTKVFYLVLGRSGMLTGKKELKERLRMD